MAFEDASFWFRHRNRCIVSMIRRFHRAGAIWDIGGGNGFVSRGLIEAGFEAVLVEPSPAGARNARERGVPTIVRSTLQDAGFHRHSLDAAGLFDVLEHIEKDAVFLVELREYLKPEGHLFMTVPAYRWLWSSNDRFSGHVRRYTVRSLEKLLTRCGFQVRYASYFFQPLILPILLFRTSPSLKGRRGAPDLGTTVREHVREPGLAGSFLQSLLDREWRRVEQGKQMTFGSSILLAASA